MPRNWCSRTLGVAGVGALVIGAGLMVAAPANAAPVADVAALRQAISDRNGSGPADEIELAPGTTYSLPGAGGCKDEDDNAAGDLDIRRSQPLKIFTQDGQQPAILDMTCDQAKSPQRVFQVLGLPGVPAGKLTLRNVVVRNGHAPRGNDGGNFGGGVFSPRDVAIENTLFENNLAGDGTAGNTTNSNGGAGGFGGAILAGGAVTIAGSTFTGNRAGTGGDGLGGNGKACEGGLAGQGGAVLAITGLTITDSTFTGNSAGAGGNGGDGRCTANVVEAGSGGTGGSGGAAQCGIVLAGSGTAGQSLGCTGAMVVRASTLSGNVAGNGGKGGTGPQGGTGGSGGLGGAILFVGNPDQAAATLLVENSTVDGNASGNGGAGGDGGNAGNGGRGGQAGAIAAGYAKRGDTTVDVAKLVHVTITENGGGGAGGGAGKPDVLTPALAAAGAPGVDGVTGGGGVAMFDSWTSVSTVIGTSTEGDGPDCWRPATNPAFSVSTDADAKVGCGFGPGGVLPFAGFAFGALADNGGPTKTRLPGAASTLVNKIAVAPNQLTTDQRGVGRPQAGSSDIGAVELQLIDPVVTKTASASTVATGTAVTFTITVKNAGTSSPQAGVTIVDPNCGTMSTASGDGNTNNTLDPGETFGYTCKATPTEVGTFTNTVTATVTDAAGVKINRTASVDVTVTGIPPLAKTGANNPALELVIGGSLVIGGVVLLVVTRPRRARVRANLD